MNGRFLTLFLFLWCAGCVSDPGYICKTSDQCKAPGRQGVCAPAPDGNSYCVFPSQCPSGYSWDSTAGPFANQCDLCSGTTRADCDKNPANGCEVDTSSAVMNCGGCGNACSGNHIAKVTCTAGACGGDCDPGFLDCNRDKRKDGCEVSTKDDLQNCGGCGTVCAPANASAMCANGACTVAACAGHHLDCDKLAASGCEVDADTDAMNCGACGADCTKLPHVASATCKAGACAVSCAGAFRDCNAKPADGCEVDTSVDGKNCGGCGIQCAFPNATATCASGVCGLMACSPNFADCNQLLADGCETAVDRDDKNCGACGKTCAVGQRCSSGACVCDGVSCPNGCCSNQICTNPSFGACGTNGVACMACVLSQANGCVAGGCRCGANPPCNGKPMGCCGAACVNTSTDVDNCGSCGNKCPGIVGRACANSQCAKTCDDLLKNQLETDVDCGGGTCPTCADGRACLINADCTNGNCSNNVCINAPQILVDNLSNPYDLAIDAANIYWVENRGNTGTLKSVAKLGGNVTTLASNLPEPTAVIVDANYAYVLERNGGSNGRIDRVPVGGGNLEVVVSGLSNSQNHLLQWNQSLYWGDWVNGLGGVIKTCAKGANMNSSVLISGNGMLNLNTALDTDGAFIYFTNDSAKILRAPLGGGNATTLCTKSASSIRIGGNTAFFTDYADTLVGSVPAGGGGVTTLASGGNGLADLAVDGSFVYFIDENNPGSSVRRVDFNGNQLKTYYNQGGSIGIEVDANFVYWITYAFVNQGKVMRAPK